MTNFLPPQEVATTLIEMGKKKVNLPILSMLILGVFAGAYIGFGTQLATVAATGTSSILGFGVTKILVGAAFSVGLMLVVIAGAELFTGNNLIIKAALKKEVTWKQLLKNWGIIYIANFIGAILLAYFVYKSGVFSFSNNELGVTALKIANDKVNLAWGVAFFRGILCNWLVCLSIMLAVASKDVIGKIFGCFFPIMTFVACGYEHSVANMYYITMGLFLKGEAALMAASGGHSLVNLTIDGMLLNNLLPVTLGNIVGGAFFVGSLYYFVYGREGK